MIIKELLPNKFKSNINRLIKSTMRDENIIVGYYLNNEKVEVAFSQVLRYNNINRYNRIAIVGVSPLMEELLCSIREVAADLEIIGIVNITSVRKIPKVIGYKEISLREAIKTADCLLIALPEDYTDIRYDLQGIEYVPDIVDLYDIDKFVPEFYNPKLEQYKNIHEGERCFVIGNGPSLTKDDLDTLYMKREICFAGNGIDGIFSETKWRPDFVFAVEPYTVNYIREHFQEDLLIKFCSDTYNYSNNQLKNLKDDEIVFHARFGTGRVNHPSFSFDIPHIVVESTTYIYCCIQVAAYMGFKEIYVLGIDNTVGFSTLHHFNDDYLDGYDTGRFITSGVLKGIREKVRRKNELYEAGLIYDKTNRMFESADRYLRKVGKRIYNATRGGKLDVIERVDFDELF